MRGILVVLLGTVLIWLGLGFGRESSAGGGEDGGAPTSAALDSAPLAASERVEPAAPLGSGSTERQASGQGAVAKGTGERSQDPAAQDASKAAPAALAPATDARPAGEGAAPPPAPPVAADFDLDSLRREESEERAFDLGDEAADPAELARTLLEAWIARDPAELGRYLEEGPGNALPLGRRQLVASFWQACMGEVARAEAQVARLAKDPSATSEQVELLRAALKAPGLRAVPASASTRDPLTRAMRMVLGEDEARAALAQQDYARAAEAWSDVVHLELSAPWPPHRGALVEWGEKLLEAQRNHRFSPLGRWPAVEYVVRPNDNLVAIRKRVVEANDSLLLCTGLIAAVNGVRGGHITPGDKLRCPTDAPNVIVDLDARVVVFRLGNEAVQLWDVGVGREGHETPIGTFEVGEMLENPAHTPIGGLQLPYGHPDNPLGTRWIAWNKGGRSTSIGFHGTSEPDGIGQRVSEGCIRMRNEDVEELYRLLPRGARILVQP